MTEWEKAQAKVSEAASATPDDVERLRLLLAGPHPKLTLVGERPDGERYYYEQPVNPMMLSDAPMLDALLVMMAERLGETAGGPCEPSMFVSPWERWDIEDGAVVAVEHAAEYGPAPWAH